MNHAQKAAEKIILDNFVNPSQRREEVTRIIQEAIDATTEDLRRRLLSAAGDDLCRLTQEEIKAYTDGTVKIPPKKEFIASCERFHAQITQESGVMENCLTLAQLIAENERLKQENESLIENIKHRAEAMQMDLETIQALRNQLNEVR